MRTKAIAAFLQQNTIPDLAALYSHDMECQVNVAQDAGERTSSEYRGRVWHGWTDGITTWKSFRIPFNANTEPTYDDYPLTWDFDSHVEGIGMTGWDWVNRKSIWFAFDFDSIAGHAKGLTLTELGDIQQAVSDVSWVSVRKSTSGNGIHLYVHLDPHIDTTNHTEHQALARAVLGQLAAETSFDFHNKVDICGSNMWVWHRKMQGTNGLQLLKSGKPLTKVPPYWRDHVKVVTGRRRKNLPQNITNQKIDETETLFEELTGQYTRVPIDTEHKNLLDYLKKIEALWWWDQDNYMLVTHTYHLKEAHEALNLRGIFNTLSTGTERGIDHNCFAFPLRKGGWAIRRFTPGVREYDTWEQDGAGWTRCFYNTDPTLATAARSHGGVEHPSGGYSFNMADDAAKTALQLGADLNLPPYAQSRPTKLKEHKDGRLIIELDKEETDSPNLMRGWIAEGKKWKRIFNVKTNGLFNATETRNFDDIVRHITTENTDCGWCIQAEGSWVEEPINHIRLALQAMGIINKEVISILGDGIVKRWKLVNRPFEAEYPGNREWNRQACQFAYFPSTSEDLSFPTWKQMLSHVGENLDGVVSQHIWGKTHGIATGCDYLMCWIASVFQKPAAPLPYLFLYGPQASGKSVLHEALSLLITRTGYQRAESALTNPSGFNGELLNSVICAVEEVNLSKSTDMALMRIKDWVTSPDILIHPKNITPYLCTNTTHWIQCANEITFCPVFTGDTRITMLYVADLPKTSWLPKTELFQKLRKEAPDFLGHVLKLDIPPSTDRLNVPVIETSEKAVLQQNNQNALEAFIDEKCFHVPGATIKLVDFYEAMLAWLGSGDAQIWTKHKITKALKLPYVKGRGVGSQHFIGNISFDSCEEAGIALTVIDQKLVPKVI